DNTIVFGATIFVRARSWTGAGVAVISVQAVTVLFSGSGSVSVAVTLALLQIWPGRLVTVTMIVSVTLPLTARFPTGHVTTASDSVQPSDAETNTTPSGNASVSTTPVAGNGPLLWTRTM